MVSYVVAYVRDEQRADGFITFAYVGEDGHSEPHRIVIEAYTEEDNALKERAKKMIG